MPQTIEELQKLVGEKDGVIAAMKKELDDLKSTQAHSVADFDVQKSEIDGLKKQINAFREAARKKLEAEVHAVDSTFDIVGKSDDVLMGFIEGFERQQKAKAGAKAPVPPIPHATEPEGKKPEPKAKSVLSGIF